MKILKRWVRNWLNSNEGNAIASKYASVESKIGSSARINFSVIPAAGGIVVSISKYDQRQQNHTESMHVIHDDEDVATNIGHIISMELLRQ